jgi:hypothetical protein
LGGEQFEADLKVGSLKDFARSIYRRYPSQTPKGVWDGVLESVAARVLEIMDEVSERGVHVVENATIADLPSLFGTCDVVTILSHWRPGWIFADQIRDPSAIEAKLAASPNALTTQLREAGRALLSDLSAATAEPFPKAFCRVANSLMASSDLGPSVCPPEWHRSDNLTYRVHANRAALDAMFVDEVVPGNRMEFADGVRSIDDILAAIPAGFEGTLDLTVCNSIMAAEEIKRRSRLTCLASEREVDLTLRMEIYAEAMRVIDECPYEYGAAIRDIRIAMLEEIQKRRL